MLLFCDDAELYVSGDNSTHHQEYNAVYGLSGRQVYLCCNFVNILVVLSLSTDNDKTIRILTKL